MCWDIEIEFESIADLEVFHRFKRAIDLLSDIAWHYLYLNRLKDYEFKAIMGFTESFLEFSHFLMEPKNSSDCTADVISDYFKMMELACILGEDVQSIIGNHNKVVGAYKKKTYSGTCIFYQKSSRCEY